MQTNEVQAVGRSARRWFGASALGACSGAKVPTGLPQGQNNETCTKTRVYVRVALKGLDKPITGPFRLVDVSLVAGIVGAVMILSARK